MTPTDVCLLFDLLLLQPQSPGTLSNRSEIDSSYVSDRLRELRKKDQVERLARATYRLTDRGERDLRENFDVPNDLVLAYWIVDRDLQAIGREGVLAIRFASGTIATYGTKGAIEAGGGRIDLGLSPRETFDPADVVELVDEARPDH